MPRVSQEQARLNRQRVVEVAAALFRERGLHGVGVADIMASAGLTHGGFYGQFANKDALAAEAFDAALGEDRRGDVDTILANYLSLGHVQAPGKGCPLAALANDVSREAPGSPVRTRFTHGVERLASILANLTPKASRERRRQKSLAALSTLVGAVVLARAVNDEALANDLLQAAHASVAS
ncbi:MAG: TetR family transcriptional regulator [Methylobacterium sp.]|uniref:TetR family transcriptional regulator n=1 Tax=unclassified Methylobacterium TaxID=2615210 RepID=UPI0006F4E4FA|nr:MULTISPECIES: TetR family transcriptional regulator [unclassified Methylobacterium]KQP05825.1 TetR family transcriptional regulator [Methylobacterium sp. Leaf99]MDO9427831.1 TetR family transcriptional regulator [Methylobacterium sp.]TXM65690.1 TetR family transcriptional regulator [Methylobacterium sp. WL69]